MGDPFTFFNIYVSVSSTHDEQPRNNNTGWLQDEIDGLKEQLALKTREIEVEKALEKIRLKALDMRNSDELSQTSALLFQQLQQLNIEAIRTSVGIFDDDDSAIELWMTSVTPEGELFFVLDYINVHVHPVFENVAEVRGQDQPFTLTILSGRDLFDYYTKMSTYTAIPDRRNMFAAEYFYSFFFSAGTINVVSPKELSGEEIDIMLRLANVFGLIYTRFLDLKKSEEQATLIREEKVTLEHALSNLKAAQAKLIQAEKMASLGELTAGIAHEIQNPLNFINNFSDINQDLLGELQSALASGEINDAITVAQILRANEEKITRHGKRADAIVKNMLEHSRSGKGEKQPTDINALCDEYLRLAYHGFRAKNKNFNAELTMDFDQTVATVNIVPQDIGRVLLNLFNNAFYAVNEKAKRKTQGYKPAIIVSTKQTDDTLEITVQDNGDSIPESIKDKIFQPFFTTKPTGEGTGLGLSLSYDIIKANGGDLEVTTKEGEFTMFVIQLLIV